MLVPKFVRYAINICTVFVVWVAIQSWTIDPSQGHYIWGDTEILNAVGRYTIPACFAVCVYFVLKYYNRLEQKKFIT